MIRHSHGAYEYLMAPEDYEYKRWTLEFNKYDLYTKVCSLVVFFFFAN